MTLMPYRTVRRSGVSEIEIRKSRFIAHVYPVTNEAEAEAQIQAIRKEHWKANHNCFAYILGKKQEIQKASDDGEPSGTAGVPILEVLRRRMVCDTLVVVTRYFGGIKLGAGGLIRAYAHTTGQGLAAAEVIDQIPSDLWGISVDYHLSGAIDNKLRESHYIIKDVQYTDAVSYEVYTKQEESGVFQSWVDDLANGRADVKKLEELYLQQKAPEPGEG
ncbi:YigZ family protein [Sporolactobacillus shoreae]|uniref:YigZ family protein n=1 Tax=Sporolactobacillus shoreae TaxID=1465501 RepID=A0A4Z0GKS9_9BACL|nr:YigZ family protein [Sporolactobacillus shoreae]TGA97550.1 YigZ family protein [Sporolactobacillus shoreae]